MTLKVIGPFVSAATGASLFASSVQMLKSSMIRIIIDWRSVMEMYNPSHPGRLIREEMGDRITVTALARHLGVTRAQLSMILNLQPICRITIRN